MNNKVKFFTVGVLLCGFGLGTAPAHAESDRDDISVSSECLKSLVSQGVPQQIAVSNCKYTITTTFSNPVLLVAKAPSSTGMQGIQAASLVTRKDWTQTFQNLSYKEVHKGTAYYDGSRAWSTTSYAGYLGSHSCHTAGSFAFAVTISNVQCTTSISPTGGSIVERETYDSYAIVQGSPISWTAAFSVLINNNGGYVERPY